MKLNLNTIASGSFIGLNAMFLPFGLHEHILSVMGEGFSIGLGMLVGLLIPSFVYLVIFLMGIFMAITVFLLMGIWVICIVYSLQLFARSAFGKRDFIFAPLI